jgi:tight adherence protein B
MMPRLLALIAAAALMVGGAGGALAQDDEGSDLPLSIDAIETRNHPSMSVTVTAPTEFAGQDIPAAAFTVTEDGQARDLLVERLPSDDLEVALVIDTSGSMGVGPMEAAKSAALGFVEQMPPDVRIAVIEFATEVSQQSDFTTDRQVTRAAISGLQASGNTALYDAVGLALDLFAGREPARRVVVLLSDGGDTWSEATLGDTIARLGDADVVLHIVELVTAELDPDALRQLAATAEGGVVSAEDSEALAGVYEDIASRLVSQFALSYESASYGLTQMAVRVEHAGVVAVATRDVQLPDAPPPPEPEPPDEAVAAPPSVRSGEIFRPGVLASGWWLYVGATVVYVALALAILLLLGPRRRATMLEHRSPGSRRHAVLTSITDRATLLAERALGRSDRRNRIARRLEEAGLHVRASEWLVLVLCTVVVLAAMGWLVAGAVGALLGMLVGLVGSRLVITVRAERRQARFADQLGETLQLIAGSLRAGYGIMQAVDVVAKETDAPTSEEFRRLLVEARLGRDVQQALRGVAERTGSADFSWVVQAMEIHREIGGDLGEILDNVGSTIRDRNQLRRQVKALSAEGRLSAVILFVLPFVVAGGLFLVNPRYLAELFNASVGRAMLVAAAVLMTVGGLWLRRIVRPVY